jgi:hypothetical protein
MGVRRVRTNSCRYRPLHGGFRYFGIGLLTTGVFLAVAVADVAGADTGGIPIARGFVTVTGLCAVLLALLYQ